MLLPYLKAINSKKMILGSQSKSRNELFQTQRLNYKTIPSTFAEDLDK
jgi:predicted house-cleaning NTP pyrophosphatase (Maf/HAM1 superfamily)